MLNYLLYYSNWAFPHMLNFLLSYSDWALLLARVVVGVTLFKHGMSKFKNLKGFGGWLATMKIPSWLAPISAITETAGGVLILFGLFTQWAALFVAVNMAVASYVDFTQKKTWTGGEHAILLVAVALLLLTAGAGAISLDSVWFLGVR